MANWCMNSLEITGTDSKVKEFVEKFSKDGVSAFVPTPKELENTEAPLEIKDPERAKENIEKYGAADWYDWRVKNWGTKWDVGELTVVSLEEEYAFVTFETAWSPIIEAMEKIAGMYPELRFDLEYEEPGMGFFGKVIFEDGKISDEWEYDWEDRFEDGWWLFKELEDVFEQADFNLNDMLSDDKITEEEYNKLLDKFDELSDSRVRELLYAIDEEDVEEVKKFLK